MARSKKTTGYVDPEFSSRNTLGLYPHVTYIYDDQGFVNWRAMVNPKSLYVNKVHFERKGEKVPESIEGLEDDALVIRQWGLRELMRLRGFISYDIKHVVSEPTHVSCISTILWMQNYETDGIEKTSTGYANANITNCSDYYVKFLEPIAENRALCRNIRNFLNIFIVSDEELDTNLQGTGAARSEASETKAQNVMLDPAESLKKLVLQEEMINNFEDFLRFFNNPKSRTKEAIAKYHPSIIEEMKSWKDFSSISFGSALALIREIEKQKEKQKK